ncbi:MAG: hypothetical protein K2N58_09920 [Treponemataceae bacterium]|nr:hypothetical protein [Treponemataceae bacterium]
MKKISNLAGIVAAAALLCGISACDNSETITMTSAKIEMVGDPIVTDKAAIFQWKDSVANGEIVITRQAPGEEEVEIGGWVHNSRLNETVLVDRVTNKNLLKAGVEYTYRFYNKSEVSSARTTEYTLEKKYSCVERKVKFESIAAAGTKLTPVTKEQVTIVKSETWEGNFVSIYVDEKEACTWINVYDKTNDSKKDAWYNDNVGGIEGLKYDTSHDYEIEIGKYWPEDYAKQPDEERYFNNSDTSITFDLKATKRDNEVWISRFSISPNDNSYEVRWSGKKDSKYEVSFEAFDNKGEEVTLKVSTIVDADIKKDDFYNCLATGKLSDLTGITDLTKPTNIKTVKAILKGTTTDGKLYEIDTREIYISSNHTTYTYVNRKGTIKYESVYNDQTNKYTYSYLITVSGVNLPVTAKAYYKENYDDQLYEKLVDLKKGNDGNLTATVSSVDKPINGIYNAKVIVTVDEAKWYDYEEGNAERVVEEFEYIY